MTDVTKGLETIYDNPDLVSSKFRTVGGYRTHYLESGNSESHPLVLVHGANWDGGLGANRWFPTVVPLGRDFHVFAPDELGGGQTDPPKDLRDIGDIRVRADHLISFIDDLEVKPVHLVGQSQGSWICAYISLVRPDLVGKMILVDTASLSVPRGGIDDRDIAERFSRQHIPGTMANRKLYEEGDIAGGMREALESMVYHSQILIPPFVEACVELASKWVPIWREPWLEFWQDGGERNRAQYLLDGVHLNELVHELPTPPLIIWGKNSVKGVQKGIDLFGRIPDAQFHLLDKADHFLWLDQWRTFNSLVRWFLVDGD